MQKNEFHHHGGEKFWVTEAGHGYGMTVEASALLHHETTPFQTIDIYQTERLGKMLLLDGIIQLTEFDEFAYQEMLAHVPLCACRKPERVLVIGGGDGGVLREIARHECVATIDLCDIDERVIACSKEYIPSMGCGFDDPRVNVHIADGSKYIADFQDYYDVIIVDSTDPGGPGNPLFGTEFYGAMRRALRHGGVIASQAESPYLLPDIVKHLYRTTAELFDHAGYGMIAVPSYPTGTIGLCVGGVGIDPRIAHRHVAKRMLDTLRYYTPEIHAAAFVPPRFVETLLHS